VQLDYLDSIVVAHIENVLITCSVLMVLGGSLERRNFHSGDPGRHGRASCAGCANVVVYKYETWKIQYFPFQKYTSMKLENHNIFSISKISLCAELDLVMFFAMHKAGA
jgi:hypothetical protein